jgi:DNA repair protein RecO (recombination protein O)
MCAEGGVPTPFGCEFPSSAEEGWLKAGVVDLDLNRLLCPIGFGFFLGAACDIFVYCRRYVGASTFPMPLVETEAIVLRTYRLGEADKIVSLFTRQMGRTRAVASGAQRTKSRYGGSLESLSYVRLWVFERENRDLGRLNAVEIIESFFDMQKDYASHVAAQYVAEVVEQLLPERDINERAFRLVLVVLRALKRSREVERPLLYFDYWILRLAGFLPDLTVCTACGRSFQAETAYYADNLPGLVGLECRQGTMAGARAMSAKSLGDVQRACATSLDKWMAEPMKPSGINEVRRFLESIVEAQAERKLITRGLISEVTEDASGNR